jgi:hypothetical protein
LHFDGVILDSYKDTDLVRINVYELTITKMVTMGNFEVKPDKF